MNLFRDFDPELPACDTAIQAVTGGTLTPERKQHLGSLAASMNTQAELDRLMTLRGSK